jgi:hypothetical protein
LIVFIIFNELCPALTIFPVFFVARRIAGGQGADRIAALAAWLFALNPTAGLAACRLIWCTTLSGLLAALLLWATLAVRESKRPAVWVGYGLLLGRAVDDAPEFPGVDAGGSSVACVAAGRLRETGTGGIRVLYGSPVLRSLDGP